MWLFESTCVVCGDQANGVCDSCVSQLESPIVPPLLAVESATVLCSYEGIGAELVTAIKYRNRRQALTPLCDALATTLPSDFDAIVAVPANPSRRRERGFDVPCREWMMAPNKGATRPIDRALNFARPPVCLSESCSSTT